MKTPTLSVQTLQREKQKKLTDAFGLFVYPNCRSKSSDIGRNASNILDRNVRMAELVGILISLGHYYNACNINMLNEGITVTV